MMDSTHMTEQTPLGHIGTPLQTLMPKYSKPLKNCFTFKINAKPRTDFVDLNYFLNKDCSRSG